MDLIFAKLRETVGAYVDDVLIYTETLAEHLVSLRQVYDILRNERFFVNPEKCSYGQPEVEYCGVLLGSNGISPQPKKLMAVYVWPTPNNPQDIKSFLGLCRFYQRFVPDYATAAAPMTDLMRKKNVWEWGTAQQRSFETIKARMLKAPVLTVPDFDKPLVLHTDASDVGIERLYLRRERMEICD